MSLRLAQLIRSEIISIISLNISLAILQYLSLPGSTRMIIDNVETITRAAVSNAATHESDLHQPLPRKSELSNETHR